MSKLNELINKFCPHGVKYVRFGDVCNLVIGFAFKSNLFRDIGNPICRTKDIQENKIDFSSMNCFDLNDYSKNLKKYIIEPNDIVIGMSGTIKVGINKTNKHCYLNQRVGKFVCDKTKIVDKFLYYFLCNSVSSITKKISDGSVKNLGNNDLLEMQIPLPPLRVQEEIVKILDKFTDLENDLENELRMRKMQFNAYLDKLLTFDNGVRFEKLGDVCILNRYKQLSAEELKSLKTNNGDIHLLPSSRNFDWITTKQLTGNLVCHGEIFTLGITRFANPKYVNGYFISSNNIIVESKNSEKISTKYLYYFVISNEKRIYVETPMYPKFDASSFNTLTIPVPPIEKQKEIVKKLDKFNDMCNEISDGLPLEIELRKKQYEFYRDKLLSFDKKAS